MSAAFNRLPQIRTYAGAKTFHGLCVPIRGRTPQVKPLGARSDWERFHIRAVQNPLQPDSPPCIECMLYKTPVVTYHPDNTVSITTGADYTPSQSTAKFISELLGPHCYATCQADRIVLVTTNRTPTGGNEIRKYAIGARNTLVFSLPDPTDPYARGLTPVDPTPQTTIVIDRAAANNVRKRYGDFYRYLKATISLRTEQVQTYSNRTFPSIQMTMAEFKQSLPTKTPDHHLLRADQSHFDMPTSQFMSNKPPLNDIKYTEWHTQITDFLCNLRNDAGIPKEEQPAHFYLGFLKLAFWSDYTNAMSFFYPISLTTAQAIKHISPEAVRSLFDELLFKFYSNEVFVTRPVTVGQAPGTKYLKWIDRTTDKF
jgi:hypothetical protein